MVCCRGDNVITVETMSGALVRIIKEVSDVKDTLERDLGSLEKQLQNDIMSDRNRRPTGAAPPPTTTRTDEMPNQRQYKHGKFVLAKDMLYDYGGKS